MDAKLGGWGLLPLFYKYMQNNDDDDDDVTALYIEIFKIRFLIEKAWALVSSIEHWQIGVMVLRATLRLFSSWSLLFIIV